MWQSLRDYHAGIPERQKRWRQAALASQEPPAQVEQHEPSSRDTTPHAAAATTMEGRNALLRDPVTLTADVMAAPAEVVVAVLSEL